MANDVIQLPPRDRLDYGSAFALLDNPFDPLEFNGFSGAALDGLYDNPIALDEHQELDELFIPAAGPFEELFARYVEVMTRSRYGPSRAPAKSLMFRVAGPQGSGKSTLVNKMVAWLGGCFTEEQRAAGVPLVIKRSLKPISYESSFTAIRNQRDSREGGWCCVVLESTASEHAEHIEELIEGFRARGTTLLLFQIYDKPRDLVRGLPGGAKRTDFLTEGLSGQHARALVAGRIAAFRDRDVASQVHFDLDCYPFDPAGVAALAGEQNSVTLRTLHHVLSEALGRELDRRTAEDRVTDLSETQARKKLIDVRAIFNELYPMDQAA